MVWKIYDENKYQKPSEINWLLWIVMFVSTFIITLLGKKYWTGGWDGNNLKFWDDVFKFTIGGLGLAFIVRVIIYIVSLSQYKEWRRRCKYLDLEWKKWGHRHLICLANFSQFPGQVSARNWIENRTELEQYIQQTLPIESLLTKTTIESVFNTLIEPLSNELNAIAEHYPIRCHLFIQCNETENIESRFRTVLQQVIGIKNASVTIELHPVEYGFKVFTPIFHHSLKEAHLFVIAQLGQPNQLSDALSSYLLILGEYHQQNPILSGKAKFYRPQLITQEQTKIDMDKFHTTLEKAKGTMPLIQSASSGQHSHSIVTYLANANSIPTEMNEFSAYTGKLGVLGDFHALSFMLDIAEYKPKQLMLANFSASNTFISYLEEIKPVKL